MTNNGLKHNAAKTKCILILSRRASYIELIHHPSTSTSLHGSQTELAGLQFNASWCPRK